MKGVQTAGTMQSAIARTTFIPNACPSPSKTMLNVVAITTPVQATVHLECALKSAPAINSVSQVPSDAGLSTPILLLCSTLQPPLMRMSQLPLMLPRRLFRSMMPQYLPKRKTRQHPNHLHNPHRQQMMLHSRSTVSAMERDTRARPNVRTAPGATSKRTATTTPRYES